MSTSKELDSGTTGSAACNHT